MILQISQCLISLALAGTSVMKFKRGLDYSVFPAGTDADDLTSIFQACRILYHLDGDR